MSNKGEASTVGSSALLERHRQGSPRQTHTPHVYTTHIQHARHARLQCRQDVRDEQALLGGREDGRGKGGRVESDPDGLSTRCRDCDPYAPSSPRLQRVSARVHITYPQGEVQGGGEEVWLGWGQLAKKRKTGALCFGHLRRITWTAPTTRHVPCDSPPHPAGSAHVKLTKRTDRRGWGK